MPSRPFNHKAARHKTTWFVVLMICVLMVALGGIMAIKPNLIQRAENKVLDSLRIQGKWLGFITIYYDPMPTYIPLSESRLHTEPVSGPLRIHPTNPRYFSDSNGNIVYLTGTHTWTNLQDVGDTDPPPVFDYDEYLNFLQEHHHNFFRLWYQEQTRWGSWNDIDSFQFTPHPYLRSGPGIALDGKPKFDVSQFNQAYFDRMRQRVEAAGQRGIYVSVMLFNGWSIEDKGLWGNNPWRGHPFHLENNVNGINGDSNNDGQGLELHTLEEDEIVALQEAYVRKVIDTVNDLDNVLYEISNESHAASTDWQYHMINFIKAYEATKPKQHPVGMTVQWRWPNDDRQAANDRLFASPADWISPAGELYNRPVATGDKVILSDTDHLCGICGDRVWVWESFTRGENPIFMDVWNCAPWWYPSDCNRPEWPSLRRNLGYTANYANRMKLAAMTPREDIASTSFALANAAESNAEYLIYAPTGGEFTVNLAATPGELSVEWFNPESGETTAGGTITGGASRSFTAPFAGDAVLYLYQTTPAPRFRLFLPVVGQGSVSADPLGPYGAGQQVTLSATPATGWGFTAWSGAVSGTQNPLTFAITQDITITATFSQQAPPPTYTLTVQTEGKGKVTVDPAGPYLSGQTITVTAVPTAGWTFVGWQGALSGSTNPATLVITTNTVLTATFIQALAGSYTVLARTNGNGAIAISASDAFTEGKTIRLTALPDPNWTFVGWSGALTGDINPITVTLTGNLTIAADFATQVFIPVTAR